MTDKYDIQLAQLAEKDAIIAEKTKALEGVNEKYSALVAKSNANVRDGKERIAAVRDKVREREATIEQHNREYRQRGYRYSAGHGRIGQYDSGGF